MIVIHLNYFINVPNNYLCVIFNLLCKNPITIYNNNYVQN